MKHDVVETPGSVPIHLKGGNSVMSSIFHLKYKLTNCNMINYDNEHGNMTCKGA